VSNPVDAQWAARVGTVAARPGPDIPLAQAAAAVAALRAASRRAIAYVADVTGLDEAADRAARVPVKAVDRGGFVRANAQLVAALSEAAPGLAGSRSTALAASAEIGLVLAFLSSRVLGQFDPFGPTAPAPCGDGSPAAAPSAPPAASPVPPPPGRLLLVAPNVVSFEISTGVPPAQFRLWVALHEVTHAVQFAAAPFLVPCLVEQLRRLIEIETDAGALTDLPRLIRALARAARGAAGANIALDVLSQPGRAVMERITAVMSLLEGHADVVMDAVGPQVIPELTSIRAHFDRRRHPRSPTARMVRRLAGLEAKTSQYVEGAAFVRGVVERVGHAGLAAVFTAEANLPTPAEIADPAAWTARVLG
jgi:coenzyme F420 biosynthesis associated uncharacterized protein